MVLLKICHVYLIYRHKCRHVGRPSQLQVSFRLAKTQSKEREQFPPINYFKNCLLKFKPRVLLESLNTSNSFLD